jgi:hypothetical protein
MPTPEELALENIDKQLTACGWTVQPRNAMNLYGARGVAVRELPLSTSEADDPLFVDRKAVEVGLFRAASEARLRHIIPEGTPSPEGSRVGVRVWSETIIST